MSDGPRPRIDPDHPTEAGSEYDTAARPADEEDARQRPPVAPSSEHGPGSEQP